MYPSMQHDISNFTSADTAIVLAVANVGTGLGKINAMLTVSRCGARRTYLAGQLLMSIFVMLLSLADSVWLIALCCFAMEVSGGPAWPAHAVIIRGHFPPQLLSKAFWILSLSSRGSDMMAKLFYGSLLGINVSWRWLLRVGSAGALIGAFFSRLHTDSKTMADLIDTNANPIHQFQRFVSIAKQKKFWIASVTMLLLTCVKASGQLTSVYFRDVTDTAILNDGGAAMMGVVFQIGLMMSVLLFGQLYQWFTNDAYRVILCSSLVVLASVAGFVLSVISNTVSDSVSLLVCRSLAVFLVALGIGTTYYIPIGVFSVEFGREDTAIVSAFLDLLGYLMSAVFMATVLNPAIKHGWSMAWFWIAVVSVAATGMTVVFLRMLLYGNDTVFFCCQMRGSGSRRRGSGGGSGGGGGGGGSGSGSGARYGKL